MLQFSYLLRRATALALLAPLAVVPMMGCSEDPEEGGSNGADASTGGDSSSTNEAGTATDSGTKGDSGAAIDDASVSDADPDGAVVEPDAIPPTVVSNFPLDVATGVSPSEAITVTFSEAMTDASVTAATFGVKQGGIDVPGSVTYFHNVATFVPANDLALNTNYVASVSTGATDLAGNALADVHSWGFKTAANASLGPPPVRLGAAGAWAILAKSAISTVPNSAITGDVGLSPAAASYITGFSLTKAGTKWTSPQVIGGVFAADNNPPTPAILTQAVGAMQTAYTDAAGRPAPAGAFTNLGGGTIGGLTFAPGLYKWTSTVNIPTNITIQGDSNDVWIFQVSGDLKLAAAKRINLSGGARAKNIFGQVAGFVELGTTSHAEGIMLSKTAITMGTGASINGRLYAQTAVTLAKSRVTAPPQ